MRQAERVVVGRIVATLLTGSLAIALAGCGGGDSGTSSAGTADASATTTNPFAPVTSATTDTSTASGATSGTTAGATTSEAVTPSAESTSGTAASGSTSGSTTPPTAAPAPAPVATSSATGVTLGWQPPTTNSNGSPITDLAGYKIHYGTTPANYTQVVSVANAGLTRYVVENLAKGTYYFAITAFNKQGLESDLSGEVAETVN